jgi:hypothetical protein
LANQVWLRTVSQALQRALPHSIRISPNRVPDLSQPRCNPVQRSVEPVMFVAVSMASSIPVLNVEQRIAQHPHIA